MNYYFEKVKYFDSHKMFKPFEIEKEENEKFRDFDRRANKIYDELIERYETPENNNRVYMNREWR